MEFQKWVNRGAYLSNGQREVPEGIKDCRTVTTISTCQGALQLPHKEIWGRDGHAVLKRRELSTWFSTHLLSHCSCLLVGHWVERGLPGRMILRAFHALLRKKHFTEKAGISPHSSTHLQSDCLPVLDISSTSVALSHHH